METELRRRRQTLYYSGRAFIIFGIWGAVKMFLSMYMNPVDWEVMIQENAAELVGSEAKLNLILYAIAFVFIMIDFGFRLFIGMSAISVGEAKKKHHMYVIASVIYIVAAIASYIPSAGKHIEISNSMIQAMILDASNLLILVIIVWNAFKIGVIGRK